MWMCVNIVYCHAHSFSFPVSHTNHINCQSNCSVVTSRHLFSFQKKRSYFPPWRQQKPTMQWYFDFTFFHHWNFCSQNKANNWLGTHKPRYHRVWTKVLGNSPIPQDVKKGSRDFVLPFGDISACASLWRLSTWCWSKLTGNFCPFIRSKCVRSEVDKHCFVH